MSNPGYGIGPVPEWFERDEDEKTTEEYAEGFSSRMGWSYERDDGSSGQAEVDPGPETERNYESEGIEDAVMEDSPDRAEPEGAAGVTHPDLTDKDAKSIASYIAEVKRWKKGRETSDNAFDVEGMQAKRILYIEELSRGSLLDRPELIGLEEYISADIAALRSPDPADGEYAIFQSKRMDFREKIFGQSVDISAEDYQKATSGIKDMMEEGEGIDIQYALLDVRRDAVLEHWDDPRFIAQIALHEGGHLKDELLSDFDRGDLQYSVQSVRSGVVSDVFLNRIKESQEKSKTSSGMIRDFMEIREMGRDLRGDQLAVMGFAEKTVGHKKSGQADSTSFEIGMAAIEGRTFSVSVLQEFWDSYPKGERKGVTLKTKDDLAALFRHARVRFEKDYKSGNPDAALSFAIMERAAPSLSKMNTEGFSPADIQAMELFGTDGRAISKNLAKSRLGQVDKILSESGEMKTTRDAVDQSDKLIIDGEGDASQEFFIDVNDKPEIRVLDGSNVEISKLKDEFNSGSALAYAGVSERGFIDLASGKITGKKFYENAALAGYDVDKLKSHGVTRELIDRVVSSGDRQKAIREFKDVSEEGYQFRLKNIVAPPVGAQTKVGLKDAGESSKAKLQGMLSQYGHAGLSFKFEHDKNGEKVASISLANGLDVSDQMLRDGYAIPLQQEAGIRQEKFAQLAEASGKGLWKDGFPEDDITWRRDFRSPKLGARDKSDLLANTVASTMAASPGHAGRLLSQKETQLFALQLEEWAGKPNVDREISKVVRRDPARVKRIYDNNMEILTDLRERNKKGKLTDDEKLSHDRLSVGRRALAESLVKHGSMTPEEAKRDSHAFLSQKSKGLSKGFREKFVKGAEISIDAASKGVGIAGNGLKRVTQAALDFAME
jgi:endonuclease YncB( thermonuclease family)